MQARTPLLIALLLMAVAFWFVGVVSAALAWSPYSRWRRYLKKRDGLPGPWAFTMDMTVQYALWAKLLGRTPDADPAVEVERSGARRLYMRFFVCAGGFAVTLAIGAAIASIWPLQ